MRNRLLAYTLAGIPAAIGIAFVARFAFVTSDTAIDGAANGFLFGMIAAGAFAGPACALAVAHKGRRMAGLVLGLLAALAIVANWSHTLGAIAHRGAGTEAQSVRAKADEKDARAELARITAELAAMSLTPATAETVQAAHEAVAAAERTRRAECGDGDPRQRGNNCRARETAEQANRDALAVILVAKAATDKANKLEADAAAIRARLAKTQPTKETNSLGEALGRLLPMSAVTAATLQQGLVSAIAELLIAAALALPELLRPKHSPAATRREQEGTAEPAGEPVAASPMVAGRQTIIAGVALTKPSRPETTGSVAQFMLACLPRATGQETTLDAIYARYRRWCEEQSPLVRPELPEPFAVQFRAIGERVKLRTEKRGGKVYCLDVRLAA